MLRTTDRQLACELVYIYIRLTFILLLSKTLKLIFKTSCCFFKSKEVKDKYNLKIYTPKDDNFMLEKDPYGLGMPPSSADVLIQPDEEIEIDGIKIKFHHFPGHTPGCSAIQINEHLFTGDFIFKGTIGRFDFPNSDAKLMKQSINKVLLSNY